MSWWALVLAWGVAAADSAVVVVDRDNVEITRSCTVRVEAAAIVDRDRNGVIHVTGEGVTVDFAGGALHGAESWQCPDSFLGVGIRVTADLVTIRGARISGFKSRLGLPIIWREAWPRTQRNPWLSGLSLSPLTPRSLPSCTSTSMPHCVG